MPFAPFHPHSLQAHHTLSDYTPDLCAFASKSFVPNAAHCRSLYSRFHLQQTRRSLRLLLQKGPTPRPRPRHTSTERAHTSRHHAVETRLFVRTGKSGLVGLLFVGSSAATRESDRVPSSSCVPLLLLTRHPCADICTYFSSSHLHSCPSWPSCSSPRCASSW